MAAAPLAEGVPGARQIGLAIVPNLAWCGFFLAFRRGAGRLRNAALTALVLAIPARALFLAAYLGATLDMNGVGWIVVAAECFSVIGWALLLVTIVANLRTPPVERTAAVLAIVVILASLDDVVVASSRLLSIAGTAAVFWRTNPFGTLWRVVGEPAVQLYWVAVQVYFLRTLATANELRAAWGAL